MRDAAYKTSTLHDRAAEWNARSGVSILHAVAETQTQTQGSTPTFRRVLSEAETFEIEGYHRVSSRGFIHALSCRVRSSQPSQTQPCKHI